MLINMETIRSCRDWNENVHTVNSKDLIFRISCYGIIVKEDRILLCPQRDGYDFPGGGMNVDETLEECLIREVKEETGIIIRPGQCISAEHDMYYSLSSQQAYNNPLLYFLCHNPQGEISTDGFDEYEREYARKAEWVSLDYIENIKFHNPIDSVSVIRKALAVERKREE